MTEVKWIAPSEVNSVRIPALKLCEEVFGQQSVPLLTDDLAASAPGTKYGPFIVVAENEGKTVGFAMVAWANLMTETYTLLWLMVDPTVRNQGIATRLIAEAESFVKIELCNGKPATVILAAEHTGTLYSRLGYQGETVNHHGAKIMAKAI